jgi:hypothetical protein
MDIMASGIFVAGGIGLLLIFAIAFASRRTKHPNIGTACGVLFAMVFFVVFCFPLGNWYLKVTTVVHLDADLADAPLWLEKHIEGHADSIDDFCYQVTARRRVRADFAMPHEDFLDWAESQNWTLEEFQANDADEYVWLDPEADSGCYFMPRTSFYTLREGEQEDIQLIPHGYFADDVHDGEDAILYVVYAIEEQRVFAEYAF